MNVPERLETPRLILRRTTIADAEAIFERYATDPEVTRHLSWKPHADIGETRDFLASRTARWEANQGFAWTILARPDDEPAGMIDLRFGARGAEAGYVLAKRYWGFGYMTEALIAVRDLAFSWPRVHRFQIVCEVDNPASARVMEKAGFEHEGVLRRYIPNPNVGDVPRDCLCYSFVRPLDAPASSPGASSRTGRSDPSAESASGDETTPSVHVRALDERHDLDDLSRCVIAFQDVERALVPSMPRGVDIHEAYVADMLGKCRRYDGRVLVVEVDESVVGYASVYARMVSDEIDDGPEPFGLIGDLFVLEAHRGRGHATRLLDAAEAMAKAKRVSSLRIGVLADNTLAAGIYTSRGFEPFALQLRKTL